ncbi:MAG: type II toxin-antitoxin system RelE/ParE family toxin [Caulobacteraceae bacterium]
MGGRADAGVQGLARPARRQRGACDRPSSYRPRGQRNLGDVRSVGDGVNELRIDHGPGYRVYFVRRGDALVVLLCGGDKRSQARDIARARRLAQEA